MAKTARIFKLDAGAPEGVRHFLSDRVDARLLANNRKTVVVTITRTGTFHDPRYGEFDITKDMLLSMVRNFEAGVYGQEIVLDVSHRPDEGAAGFFRRLFISDNKLRGEVELTEYGIDAITKRGFIYLSAEFHENFIDNEQRKPHGPTLLGAALTPRPVIKKLDPIKMQLAEESTGAVPTYVSQRVAKYLTELLELNMKDLLKQLRKKLSEFNLAEAIVSQLLSSYEAVASKLADEEMQTVLMSEFVIQGEAISKQLASAGGDTGSVKLDFSGLEKALGTVKPGMTEDQVLKLMEDAKAKEAQAAKKLNEDRQKNVDLFNKLLTDAEGLKNLGEEQRKELGEVAEMITAEMSEDQVTKLAEHQIKMGDRLSVNVQLSGLGFPAPGGSPRITLDETNNVKKLQETIDRRLGLLDMPESRRYAKTGGKLQEDNKKLAERALALYDQQHGPQLARESKLLAAGDGIVSDISVPSSWERTVIREALYQLVGLQFVNAGVEQFATSYSIPYSYRDTTAAGRGNTRVYEGGSIPRAGVIQTAETAYNTPQKLAFEISDELRYLTQGGPLNWNALTENQQNASRIVGEDLEQLIFNELVHASDEYGATAVVAENLELQADDTKNIFVLANFPVVRPRAVYDLQGNQIGSTTNAITVTYDSVARAEYDGTGTQSAGIYYSMDYNLGEIRLVNQLGVIQVPANATAYTISYSYTTNVYNFDTDLGSSAADAHWDTYLYRYGLRKAVIEDDRYHMANFGVMSGTHMTQVEQAKQFGANSKRPGTDLMADGNLGRIKDIANYKTSAPGLWIGDQRAIIGERGITRVRMTKPWTLGELQDQKDANGRFTGKKEAYGDQFVVVHTPTQLKRAYTSVNLYSATARVARAA